MGIHSNTFIKKGYDATIKMKNRKRIPGTQPEDQIPRNAFVNMVTCCNTDLQMKKTEALMPLGSIPNIAL